MTEKSNSSVVLYDIDGVYVCPRCFQAIAKQRVDATVLEISLSMFISLSAVLNQAEFVCSECGEVVTEISVLRLDNETDTSPSILENIPAQCPFCSGDDIFAEFEELEQSSPGITNLELRRWICLSCDAESQISAEGTIACRMS